MPIHLCIYINRHICVFMHIYTYKVVYYWISQNIIHRNQFNGSSSVNNGYEKCMRECMREKQMFVFKK